MNLNWINIDFRHRWGLEEFGLCCWHLEKTAFSALQILLLTVTVSITVYQVLRKIQSWNSVIVMGCFVSDKDCKRSITTDWHI